MKHFLTLLGPLCLFFANATGQATYDLTSPNGRIELEVRLGEQVRISIKQDGQVLVAPSPIALELSEGRIPAANARVLKDRKRTVEAVWSPVVQQKSASIEEHYRELQLQFRADYRLTFRAYDNGIAYRFETEFKASQIVRDEILELNLPANDSIFYPEEESFYSHNERVFLPYAVSNIQPGQRASLPVLIASTAGPRLLLTESDLRDYPGLWVEGTGGNGLKAIFPAYPKTERAEGDRDVRVSEREGFLARTEGVRTYPWRIIGIFEEDKDIIRNQLTYLLSRPAEGDFSWVKPGKVAWDWYNYNNIYGVDFRAGINTQTYRYFIDFAAANGIEYIVLDEGWSDTEDLLKTTPGMDLEEICAYAKEKQVGVIFWVLWNALDRQLEPALDLFTRLGGAGIKIDFMQRDDQKMVNYYWRIAEAAAEHKLLVDYHGSYKPAGLHRTWPNVITREGVRGLEWSKWDTPQTISPEHNVTLPFTRMAVGPMDYTPGAMLNAQSDSWFPSHKVPMSLGTRCHQMAMYAVYESPLQMLADSPTHYERERECLDFIKQIPTVWEQTVPLAGRVGDYVAVARRAADGSWYIGAMTDWSARELELELSFLGDGDWKLEVFQDGINADRNANDYQRTSGVSLPTEGVITINMAPGGGWIARATK